MTEASSGAIVRDPLFSAHLLHIRRQVQMRSVFDAGQTIRKQSLRVRTKYRGYPGKPAYRATLIGIHAGIVETKIRLRLGLIELRQPAPDYFQKSPDLTISNVIRPDGL